MHDEDSFTISAEVNGNTYTRNVFAAVALINGYDVFIVNIHLTPGHGEAAAAARLIQADVLIAKIKTYGYDHVLICGDFNCTAGSDSSVQTALFDKFVTDGYACLNNGYFGSIETVNDTTYGSEPIDNILAKGFKIYGVESKPEWACTSDHYPLVGYITLR